MIKENPGSAPATSSVVYIQSDSAPRDYVIWSLFNTLFMNSCCLGFIAYIYSVKARDKKMAGDVIGATTYASKAKRLNICAVVTFALMFIITIISFVVLKKNVGNFRFSFSWGTP